MTVTGPLAPDDLGHTVTSVHLVSDLGDGAPGGPPVTMDLLGALTLGAPNRDDLRLTEETARPELADFAALGGGAVVETTCPDLGRDPAALARLARATGVHVIMGCGRHSAPADSSAEDLAEEIVRDLRDGAGGVRAGVIGRIGALDPDRPADRALAEAVADAARRTGAPVLVDRGAADTVLDLLAAVGGDAGRVAVGGCDALATDVGALAAFAGRGAYVQFDGLGRLPTVYSEVDDQDVAAAVLALAGRGHAERILLSPGVSRKSDLKGFGGGGYGFVVQQFAPYLGFTGADEALLHTLTVTNPQRWLTITEEPA
ncbi:phosphotriesterase [Actinomadura graeca]|uniref:Phosphotriesterase n=1 Tax=Actinomadura graeca TaxID=2750812 RepID=A0ABX8QUD8_9ACTN|nr:phosphotriesterase [Actinomadura graeca]QXJ22352.1 phosphotriesterase [Actinomadura graeca]